MCCPSWCTSRNVEKYIVDEKNRISEVGSPISKPYEVFLLRFASVCKSTISLSDASKVCFSLSLL